MNKIFKALLSKGGLYIFVLTMTGLLSSCFTTKEATKIVKAYDNNIFEKQAPVTELPSGISLNLINQLPDSTSAKKSSIIVLPLLFINYWQEDFKLTMGQSSLETPTVELFKSELLHYFEFLGWEGPYQHGYSINIDVLEIEASGVYLSGAYLIMLPGAADGRDITQCRIHSKVHIAFNLNLKDSLIARSDFFLSAEGSELGTKLVIGDNKTTKKIQIQPLQKYEKSFEFLIPAAKELYSIGIKCVSREIVLRVRNLLSDFYSGSNNQEYPKQGTDFYLPF